MAPVKPSTSADTNILTFMLRYSSSAVRHAMCAVLNTADIVLSPKIRIRMREALSER